MQSIWGEIKFKYNQNRDGTETMSCFLEQVCNLLNAVDLQSDTKIWKTTLSDMSTAHRAERRDLSAWLRISWARHCFCFFVYLNVTVCIYVKSNMKSVEFGFPFLSYPYEL